MKKPKWEKEFDREFGKYTFAENCESGGIAVYGSGEPKRQLKSFIRHLLSEERKQWVKVHIWEGRISLCCSNPVIRLIDENDECLFYCGRCGKLCNWERISQK